MISGRQRWLVLLLPLALAGCPSSGPSCPDGTIAVTDSSRRVAYCAPVCSDAGVCACPADRVSIWIPADNAAACAPACGDGGACPGGLACQTCLAPGDCPTCDVCVAACAQPP